MLRKQYSETQATYGDPYHGVNLRDSAENLQDGEARMMQNCEYYGSLRIRRGSQRITPTSLGPYRILGGHKYYRNIAVGESLRLIAYNDKVSAIDNAGAETVIGTGLTPDLDTYFRTWSITDSVYISNGTDVLHKYDGVTFGPVMGTNIPILRSPAVPILDRLIGLTIDGIERRDPNNQGCLPRYTPLPLEGLIPCTQEQLLSRNVPIIWSQEQTLVVMSLH